MADRPRPRLIRNPHDAEEAAAEWLRWFGFEDATATNVGADGGVDVRGRSMVAQVKAHMVPIGRPDLQRLYGVAQVERATSVFFSLMHYTRDAQEWAEQVGMALFRFDHAGVPEAVNSYASSLVERADHKEHVASAPPPAWGLPVGCGDDAAYQALSPGRAVFRQQERVAWVRQGWLPAVSIRYDFTYVDSRGRRPQELFAQTRAAFELLLGRMIGVPATNAPMVQVPPEHVTLTISCTPDEVISDIMDRWEWYQRTRHPAGEWPRAHAAAMGIPPVARSLFVSAEGTFLLPYFAALIQSPAGSKVSALEGVTGRPHEELAGLFTRLAPVGVLNDLHAGRQVGPT